MVFEVNPGQPCFEPFPIQIGNYLDLSGPRRPGPKNICPAPTPPYVLDLLLQISIGSTP